MSKSPDDLLLDQNKTIEIAGKKYQYGVKIKQNSIGVDERVIFELVDSESKQTKRQLLYNLEQTKKAGAGVELGDPEILPPVIYGDRSFWSIFTYHGEGFGGIATTLWLATQLTEEGNPYMPSMGLVAYRPSNADNTQGEIFSYRVDNSPMVGAIVWQEYYDQDVKPPVWRSPLYWAGDSWHWNGKRFVRGLDEVELNLVGGGVRGISVGESNEDYIFDTQAMRGDLELLELTKNSTRVKYYSAWVEDDLLKPYITIVPQTDMADAQPNPLLEIKSRL